MTQRGVLALVVCAAPPVLRIGELIELLHEDGWTVCVTATPTAARWIDRETLGRLTGYPVRVEWRMPDEPESQPPADLVVVVPATFNVINKWALGINDTLALGVLNEALGARIPVYAFPNVNKQLAAHLSYSRHLQMLRDAGVIALPLPADPRWQTIVSGSIASVELPLPFPDTDPS